MVGVVMLIFGFFVAIILGLLAWWGMFFITPEDL